MKRRVSMNQPTITDRGGIEEKKIDPKKYFEKLSDLKSIQVLYDHYKIHEYVEDTQYVVKIIEMIHDNIDIKLKHSLMDLLLLIINEDIACSLIKNGVYRKCLDNFPEGSSLLVIEKILQQNSGAAIALLESDIIEKIFPLINESNKDINYVINFFAVLGNYAHYYQRYFDLYKSIVDLAYSTRNVSIRTECLRCISNFCYNSDFALYFLNHSGFRNITLSEYEVPLFLYIIQLSFEKDDTFPVEDGDSYILACEKTYRGLSSKTIDYILTYSINCLKLTSSEVIEFAFNVIEKCIKTENEVNIIISQNVIPVMIKYYNGNSNTYVKKVVAVIICKLLETGNINQIAEVLNLKCLDLITNFFCSMTYSFSGYVVRALANCIYCCEQTKNESVINAVFKNKLLMETLVKLCNEDYSDDYSSDNEDEETRSLLQGIVEKYTEWEIIS